MTPSKVTSGQQAITRRDWNALVDQSARLAGSMLIGGDDSDFGNPVMSVNLESEQGCWAKITDFCRDGNNNAITDGSGQYLYQWVEQTCDLSGSNVVWRDKTALEGGRGSVQISTGVYLHAAMELNNTKIDPSAQPREWVYPGFLQFGASSSRPDHRHVFQSPGGGKGVQAASFTFNGNNSTNGGIGTDYTNIDITAEVGNLATTDGSKITIPTAGTYLIIVSFSAYYASTAIPFPNEYVFADLLCTITIDGVDYTVFKGSTYAGSGGVGTGRVSAQSIFTTVGSNKDIKLKFIISSNENISGWHIELGNVAIVLVG